MPSISLPAIGAAVSAAGTLFSGIAGAGAASYNAQVAKNNAQVERQNAASAIQAGQAQAEAKSREGAQKSGLIKAGIAANGVDINTGSAVDVQASQREVNQLDTETVLHNAQLQAYGYRVQATNDLAQAKLDQSTATSDLISAPLSAFGSGASTWKWLGGTTS